jgi:anti-anti-sigma factor
MDSTGLRLLLRWDGEARSDGMQLRLRPGPPAVQRVLAVSGLLERLPFASE